MIIFHSSIKDDVTSALMKDEKVLNAYSEDAKVCMKVTNCICQHGILIFLKSKH